MLLQELKEEVEQLKQERDAALEELVFANRQIKEQDIELNAALAERTNVEKERDDANRQKEDLERTLKEERQKTTEAKEEQGRLQELLSLSEKSNDEIRKQLREGHDAQGIPSSDLQLTDIKLGEGSYGGVFCSVFARTHARTPTLALKFSVSVVSALYRGTYCLLERVSCCCENAL